MKRGNIVNKKGTLWRICYTSRRGGYEVNRIDKTGKRLHFEASKEKGTTGINGLPLYSFEEAPEIPPEPKEKR